MADNSWKHLEEPWERVKWARKRHFPSAVAAAEALDIKDGTYRCYERGPGSAKWIPLEYGHAKRFAQLFKVRWEWLLDGAGEPWLTRSDAERAQGPDDEGDYEDRGPPNHLRAWREHRGLTIADLSVRSGLSAQTISDLENGRDFSTKLLARLGDALNVSQGHLLDHLPDEVDPELWAAVTAVPKERRGQAIEILKTFRPYQRRR